MRDLPRLHRVPGLPRYLPVTRKVEVALGFMIVSNVYTTVGYFLHERICARIPWGTESSLATAHGDANGGALEVRPPQQPQG
jgi:uncharacterized membrane protein